MFLGGLSYVASTLFPCVLPHLSPPYVTSHVKCQIVKRQDYG